MRVAQETLPDTAAWIAEGLTVPMINYARTGDAPEATGLPSGKYLVRYAATDTKSASPCLSLNLVRTVATGDNTPVMVLAVLLAVSAAMGTMLIRRRKTENR